jgi:hypothetical protein
MQVGHICCNELVRASEEQNANLYPAPVKFWPVGIRLGAVLPSAHWKRYLFLHVPGRSC